ncbi:PilZ domain-containing protein [Methylobacterium segetis]|uniref:PilZ domain-containing protein n=1 Tax=Methylobacterium segetis TaxID=2488750 RepID=UPI001FE0303F|nr:PilZ domain-containing protein [Methylobacterium segetis]
MDEPGFIALDEHSSMGCIVYDVSNIGVRVTMLETKQVPDVFFLSSPSLGPGRVCRTAWRKADEIGAFFAQTPA